MSVVGGRGDAARSELASWLDEEPREPRALFCRGYQALYDGRFAEAGADFARCEELSAGGPFEPRAAFYRCLAGMAAAGAPARTGARLVLIGLGVNPPYSATAADVAALRGCDVVFNNIMGDEMFEFIRPFCHDCRPIAYHQNNDEGRLSDVMLGALKEGGVVGFVTRGSAVVYGPLGAELLRRCRESGVAWRCLAAVSSSEVFTARHPEPGSRAGLAVVDSAAAGAGALPDPRLSATVYLNLGLGPRHYDDVCARLAARYGADHECLV
jgi:hypothetical protein